MSNRFDLFSERFMNGSLFERLGGFARVRIIVSDFYYRVLESPTLARYFLNTDMRHLIDHQTKFIAAIMGGPASFTNEQIARVHRSQGISVADFDELRDILRETMEDFDLGESDIERVLAHLESMRTYVVDDALVPRT